MASPAQVEVSVHREVTDSLTTQRAYTFSLRPFVLDADRSEFSRKRNEFQEAAWNTHSVMNLGTKEFADWLLTLRGGLSHELIHEPVQQRFNRNALGTVPETPSIRKPNDQEIADRRRVLGLCWFSVESISGAPQNEDVLVAGAAASKAQRQQKLLSALREVLRARQIQDGPEIDEWIAACSASFLANIRPDAVWVNRSLLFDQTSRGQDETKARADCRSLLFSLFTSDLLTLPRIAKTEESTTNAESDDDEKRKQAREQVIQSGTGAGQRTRHIFSHLLGSKKDSAGFGKPPQKLLLRDFWREYLLAQIARTGLPLRIDTSKEYEDRSPGELHRLMLSKAAARLAQIHTKQKQQEVERDQRRAADESLSRAESDGQLRVAIGLLEKYCSSRGVETGANDEYLIRPTQCIGWNRLLQKWREIEQIHEDLGETDRVDLRKEAAKNLQDEMADEKFGDVNLYCSLAEEEFKPIWREGIGDRGEILGIFAKGKVARFKSEKLKVAAYRHPDPFRNPVFCQFGNSKPKIKFNRLTGATPTEKIELQLWDGQHTGMVSAFAGSERFNSEIGVAPKKAATSASSLEKTPPLVSRRNRLSSSEAGGRKRKLKVALVFDRKPIKKRKESKSKQKERVPLWNGTLQADRRALRALGEAQGSAEKFSALRMGLKWSLTVALELRPDGPWLRYWLENRHRLSGDADKAKRLVLTPEGDKNEWRGLAFPFWHPQNEKGRQGMAKHILSRLPGLRILSADLGHRYAVACAVWETLSRAQFESECGTSISQGKNVEPANFASCADSLFARVTGPEQESKATEKAKREGRVKKFKPAVLYRRIGADALPGGVPHPAPWARLDRQFTIKLQGEREAAREASNEEVWAVHQFELSVGMRNPLLNRLMQQGWGSTAKQRARIEYFKSRGWEARQSNVKGQLLPTSLEVDELMAETLRNATLAQRRHGDAARISWNLAAMRLTRPGGKLADHELAGDELLQHLAEVLRMWHQLAFSPKWDCPWAREAWDQEIQKLMKESIQEIEPEQPREVRRELEKKNHELLLAAAAQLASQDRTTLSREWARYWDKEEPVIRKHLQWLREWLKPTKAEHNHGAIRYVGGLSLQRIENVTALYKLQKAYRDRPEPDDLRRNIKSRGEREENEFSPKLLRMRERLRENRVKQLSSRLVEAALGIGAEPRPNGKRAEVRPADLRFSPCHAIVIENLGNYRPDQLQTRRENRQLMSWSAGQVRKFLAEGCQLNGIHLREVSPGYTSRQDSRTSAAGLRCEDVPVRVFVTSPFWRKRVATAKKVNVESGSPIDSYLYELSNKWNSEERVWTDFGGRRWRLDGGRWVSLTGHEFLPRPLRIPVRGGSIFVSSEVNSRAAGGIQADLNAAANVGLKALFDPDWNGRWWFFPVELSTGKPQKKSVAGSLAFGDSDHRFVEPQSRGSASGKKSKASDKPIINVFREVSCASLHESSWSDYKTYWLSVDTKVVDLLRQHNAAEREEVPF